MFQLNFVSRIKFCFQKKILSKWIVSYELKSQKSTKSDLVKIKVEQILIITGFR